MQITQAAELNIASTLIVTDRDNSRWNIMFADALILLFEKVARVIEAYQPLIQTYYGRGNMKLFIKNIQTECDLQALKILQKFKQTRNLTFICKRINMNNSGSNLGTNSSSNSVSISFFFTFKHR
jgi:hypothetical protein